MVLQQAKRAGCQLRGIQEVDSVHRVANVDTDADRERQGQSRPPRDRQAQLVKKGVRRQMEPDGQVRQKVVQSLGHKSHVSLDAESGLITSILPTSGKA